MKTYCLWTRYLFCENCYLDPTKGYMDSYSSVTFTETEYYNNTDIYEYIGIMEGDESDINGSITYFSSHEINLKTPAQIITLLNSWYGNYFTLDSDDFTIIDDRPEEEDI